ncbi:MAG: ABC transporter permease [Mesorhizobium sp.]|uniref:ABC transporter permease n=1 Tax=Mesorhizobium sp. TaxID=1871066 RepID=UPI000FE741AE|nr:ABC transporter permease [Mesorhizobium sp.]RWI50269.1 MAG: ABC transporter permease [Mesorhizobium sp.]
MTVHSAHQPEVLPESGPRRSRRGLGLRNLNRQMLFGLVLLSPLLGVVFAPLLTAADPMRLGPELLTVPSLANPMGTDDLGRDVFARVLYGGRVSLVVGLTSALIAAFVGTLIGTAAGYAGGVIDDALMRLTELFQIIPRFLLAIVVVALFGGGNYKIVLIIGLLSWPGTARIIRAQLLVLRREEFVLAAIMGGASPVRVVLRQILPNLVPFIIVSVTLATASAMLAESFLSFLGLGDPTRPSWGLLLQQAQLYLKQAWWMSVFPGLLLSMTILGLNILGDGFTTRFGAKVVR